MWGCETQAPSVIKGIIAASTGLGLLCVRSFVPRCGCHTVFARGSPCQKDGCCAPCLQYGDYPLPQFMKFLVFLFKFIPFPWISMVTGSPNTFCKIPASNCQAMPLSGFVYMTLRLSLLRTLPCLACLRFSPLLAFSATSWL